MAQYFEVSISGLTEVFLLLLFVLFKRDESYYILIISFTTLTINFKNNYKSNLSKHGFK